MLSEAGLKWSTAPVRGLGLDHHFARRECLAYPFPSATAVGIALIEDADTSSAPSQQMFDQALGLLSIRGPQVEDELAIRRQPGSLGSRERKKQQIVILLMDLQKRQDARDGRSAHVSKQQESAVFFDQPRCV